MTSEEFMNADFGEATCGDVVLFGVVCKYEDQEGDANWTRWSSRGTPRIHAWRSNGYANVTLLVEVMLTDETRDALEIEAPSLAEAEAKWMEIASLRSPLLAAAVSTMASTKEVV